MPEAAPRPVLLDTDIGTDVDDALALGLLLALEEDLSLVAVTTVCGDTRTRARIAAGLLAMAGRGDVEVCAGEERPLLRPPERFAWFGHEEKCVLDPDAPISEERAPERIVRAAREVEGLEIILIGPLTNLARALVLDPELPRRVAGITVMGGHIREVRFGDVPVPPGIDYNLCSDPEATVAVLGAGFETTLVSADVTVQTWLNDRDLAGLEKAGPIGQELARQIALWSPVQRSLFGGFGEKALAPDNQAFLHDPLTILALCEPELLGFEMLDIIPTIRGGVLRTLESRHGGNPMRVATAVDARRAARAITSRLLGI